MQIAVLGWGSLLWSPRDLEVREGKWLESGPWLPVEFSRIASDGRLTLVIDPSFPMVKVYWRWMKAADLYAARENLRAREGADHIDEIGYYNSCDNTFQIRPESVHLIQGICDWCKDQHIDAVIWTDLSPKFKAITNYPFTLNNAIKYLSGLNGNAYDRAREYILKAPPQTATKFRAGLEKHLSI